MNKSVLAIATAVLAISTMFASGAEAHGFGMHFGFGGPLPVFNAYSNSGYYGHKMCHHTYQAARREVREPVHVAKKSNVDKTSVASLDADKQNSTVATNVAELENSSIAVSTGDVADSKAVAPIKTAAVDAVKIGCKEFFPSAGMTLTVPCQ